MLYALSELLIFFYSVVMATSLRAAGRIMVERSPLGQEALNRFKK